MTLPPDIVKKIEEDAFIKYPYKRGYDTSTNVTELFDINKGDRDIWISGATEWAGKAIFPDAIESKLEEAAQQWESATQHEGLGPAIFKAGVNYAMAYAKVTEQAKTERLVKALENFISEKMAEYDYEGDNWDILHKEAEIKQLLGEIELVINDNKLTDYRKKEGENDQSGLCKCGKVGVISCPNDHRCGEKEGDNE